MNLAGQCAVTEEWTIALERIADAGARLEANLNSILAWL